MNPLDDFAAHQTRRAFLGRSTLGLGSIAMGALMNGSAQEAAGADILANLPHFAPKAKRVIYLFQSGGPSQMDLFDYKPGLTKRFARSYLPRISSRAQDDHDIGPDFLSGGTKSV